MIGMVRMMKTALLLLIVCTLVQSTAAQSRSTMSVTPEGFKTDGCSMFPDGCYRDCCVEHDLAYFLGGDSEDRRKADRRLRDCVSSKEGFHHRFLGPLMWLGVRVGGTPLLPTPFRWSYGEDRYRKALGQIGIN